jgi:Cof subfamily protein (haloacid dehalogenase superfamily)
MSIKLIVTDLDGTFLNSNHVTIPQENIEAFKKAHEMGIKVAIASGRTKILTDYLMEQLPFLDYLITSNGAVTYDVKTGEIVCQTLLSNEKSVEIFNILKDYNLIYEIYYNGDCFMNKESYSMFDENRVAPHIFKLLSTFIKEVPDLELLIDGNGIEKLNILTLSAEQRVELEGKISESGGVAFASSFPVTTGKNGNLEMTEINATKGFAVKGLAESLSIGKENIMCFGDGENDCPMLTYADYSFAMANGSEIAKNTAKYMTDTNDNGGVAKAISKYVFGE